ncbi:GntR family transcriptional regulator [Inquilinus sp. CAU 1745]|uniref:GntR family transcriptional regulator n=1 Tax=Inquilinus sp. CAU 1745 TaxID=3140369 RepID=UPI00325B62B1
MNGKAGSVSRRGVAGNEDALSTAVEPAAEEGRADAAYRFLRNAILSNELPAGFQAAENEIAARLGMSRTPVHEAMARLQEEGFVQILPRKGILVKALSPADLLEIYDVLIALEGAAAERLAGGHVADVASVLDELAARTADMEAALRDGDLERWAQDDEAFHDTLVARCGNGRIRRMAATVTGQSHRARRLTLHLRPLPLGSAAEHRAIIDAIRSGDAAAAGTAARSHRSHARDQLVPILDRLKFATL